MSEQYGNVADFHKLESNEKILCLETMPVFKYIFFGRRGDP